MPQVINSGGLDVVRETLRARTPDQYRHLDPVQFGVDKSGHETLVLRRNGIAGALGFTVTVEPLPPSAIPRNLNFKPDF
jgi:hypothetical protein